MTRGGCLRAGRSASMQAVTRGRYFEEFTVGERFVTRGRTITEADIVAFAALGLTEGTVIAIVYMTWDFTAPIRIGDTIHVDQTVKSMRETKKADRGIIVFEVNLINQRGEGVQKGERVLLVARKSAQG